MSHTTKFDAYDDRGQPPAAATARQQQTLQPVYPESQGTQTQ